MKILAALAIASLALTWSAGARPAAAAPATLNTCGSDLQIWFAPQGNGYAGGAGYVVELSNTGKTACSLQGYPTMKLTENGKQVGLVSTHDPLVPARTVRLAPGQTAHVVLLITDAGAICRPLPTNGLSVRAPGGAPSLFLLAGGACRGRSTLRVDAINPGVGIPFYTTH